MEMINSPRAPVPPGQFSQAVKTSSGLFVSAQLPYDRMTGQMIRRPFEDAFEKALFNVGMIFHEAGLTLEHASMLRVYVIHLKYQEVIYKILDGKFSSCRPALSVLEIRRMPENAPVMIEAFV